MRKLMQFTAEYSGAPIHIKPQAFIGFMPVYAAGAKPEDKAQCMLLFVHGISEHVRVAESYGQVINILRQFGLQT